MKYMRSTHTVSIGMLKERNSSEDLGVGGRIKLKWMLGIIMCEDGNWLYLAEVRDRWQAAVNTLKDLPVPEREGF
jgi:hypothetical protein